MAKAIYVESTGIESCISKINTAIEGLQAAASSIEASMNELPEYWQGASADSAQATYAGEYKTMLTKTVPDAVEGLNNFINNSMKAMIEADLHLAGTP